MAAVPQVTLTWLYTVLTKNHHDPNQTYHDPDRTYHDVASTLAYYPSFAPRTDVYTSETGVSSLLLHLVGTLPVSFRGTVYQFPLDIWIPNHYPREPPIVYVVPTQDMVVRVGQHVTLEGRVYHHYLAHWVEGWDRSSIVDFLFILREVFAKEPPVKHKQSQMQVSQESQQTQPPPVPSLPLELAPATSSRPLSIKSSPPMPPQLPPKPGQTETSEQREPSDLRGSSQTQSPLPPLPPKARVTTRPSFAPPDSGDRWPNHATSQHIPHSSLNTTIIRRKSQREPQSVPPRPSYSQESIDTQIETAALSGHSQQPGSSHLRASQSIFHGQQRQHSSHYSHQSLQDSFPPHQQPQSYHSPNQRQVPQQQVLNKTLARVPKHKPPDLLTSPFELELPSVSSSGSAPPIPPNPEKDALLHALSQILAESLRSNVSQARSAIQPLGSQSKALHAAMATLQSEIAALSSLQSTLQSNISILQQSLHRADAIIADAQARISVPPQNQDPSSSSTITVADGRGSGLPAIDDVLVVPTIAGKQLYDLVADERGIQQAIYALQVALVKGVIGADSWSRHTRSLAREAFLKRALIQKIGKGMGLEDNI